ncbi:MAG: TSUP family transporter, partial [Bacteroidota bacterium]
MLAIEQMTLTLWLVLIVSAFFTGMAKTGVFGLSALVAPILASAFGGKVSAGLLLPMLSMADITAVIYYNRHASWVHLWKLFPFAAAGVLLALWVGELINDNTFKIFMAIFI